MMLRLALVAACLNLVGYLIAMRFIPWIGLFQPRGGIVMFAVYLTLAVGVLWYSKKLESNPKERIGGILGGWIMLLMPPLWWWIEANV